MINILVPFKKTLKNIFMLQPKSIMITKYIDYLAILMTLICLHGCGHIELPKNGVVIDADTGTPIKDVTVFNSLNYTCPNVAGRNSTFLQNLETATDSSGKYSLPGATNSTPHPFCSTVNRFRFFKPGYFRERPFRTNNITKLYKMNHYLDFRPYREPYRKDMSISDDEVYLNDSDKYIHWLEITKTNILKALDKQGVFLKIPNRKFTKIYSRTNYFDGDISYGENIIYVFDYIKQEWLTLDARGAKAQVQEWEIPSWTYMSFADFAATDHPIFATNDSIYITKTYSQNHRPEQKRSPSEIYETIKVSSLKGGITGLSGNYFHFLTIEGNGKYLCYYNELKHKDRSRYNNELYETECYEPKDILKMGSLLPGESGTIKFIDNGIIALRTNDKWYIFQFMGNHHFIKKILEFSNEKKISAIAKGESNLYISFDGGFIKKYSLGFKRLPNNKIKTTISEDKLFAKNTLRADFQNVISMTASRSINIRETLYAVTGDDVIYRFAPDGTPDYRVELDQK